MDQLPAAIQAIEPIVNNYGYLAVGGLLFVEDFGVPSPGETVLIAASFFAGIGSLNIYIVLIVGLIGAILGDNVGYAIGKYGGHPLVQKFGRYIFLTPKRIQKAESYFNNHGGKVVVVARFFEGLRQANGIIAGLSEMTWWRFLTFNIIGASLWVGFWASVGYLGGNNIGLFLKYQSYLSAAALILVAAVICYIVIKNQLAKRSVN